MIRSAVVALAIFAVGEMRALANRQAAALATVTAGYVSSVTVTDGGSGYEQPPAVSFSGGGGIGATGVAVLNGDSVGAVVVTRAGIGYTAPPNVVVAPPQPPPPPVDPATLSIDTVPRLVISGISGSTNTVEWAVETGNPTVWHPLATVILDTAPTILLDPSVPLGGRRIYRVVTTNSEPPGRPEGFVWIHPGTFRMGSPLTEPGRQTDEIPHNVRLTRGFWISTTETTAGQYARVTQTNPNGQTDPSKPVLVTWGVATNYCVNLTALEAAAGRLPAGYAYRLPTEAEWEYCARAGTKTAYYFGDDSSIASQFEWRGVDLRPVGLLKANPWGLFDMLSNSHEWCSDWYDQYPLWDVVDPTGGLPPDLAGPQKPKVVRGTSVLWGLPDFRCAARKAMFHDSTSLASIRCVLGPVVP